MDGECVHGVLIDCGKDQLMNQPVQIYRDVTVLHSDSTVDEIYEYLDACIPMKMFCDVFEKMKSGFDE